MSKKSLFSPITLSDTLSLSNPIVMAPKAMCSVKGSEETHVELLKAIQPLNLLYVHSIRSPDKNIDIFKLVRDHHQGISIPV